MNYLFRIILVLIACVQLSARADDEPQTLEELKIAIEKVRVESGLPGLGVALVDKNGPYWVAGMGVASLETKVPVNQDSLFRIGSSSKMFVALSVLKLVEQGKLHLTDKLSDLAPEIYFENPWEKTNPILLVNLLEHTTGWDDISYKVYARQDANITLKDALDFHPSYRKSRWVPGTRYAYNNAGPAVAAYIVQKISGQEYESFVQENFFNPLQMTSTTFHESALFKTHGVTLYSADATPQPYWAMIMRPAGALNSSASDMAKYLHFLIARGTVNQQTLLTEASLNRMETSTSTLGAQLGTKAGYGLHNFVTGFGNNGIAFRGHDGDVSGGHCILNYVPELNMGFVVLINQDNLVAHEKIPKLIRTFLLKGIHKEGAKEVPMSKKLQELDGYYIQVDPRSDMSRFASEVLGVMRFKVSNNHLHREPLLGGWEKPSDDYPIGENLLANTWSGLATIAIVNDPLIGEVVEVSDDLRGSLYKKVSAVRVYGILGWFVLTLVLCVSSIVFALIWSVQLVRGKLTKGANISVRAVPLVTTLVMAVGLFSPQIFHPSVESMGEMSVTNVVMFLSSIIFPMLAIFGLYNAYKNRLALINNVVFWHSVMISVGQCGVALVLGYYGLLALRMWV